jgi:hypothetical protein
MVFVLLSACVRSVLPPGKRLMALSEAEIRNIILEHAALGSSRSEVERALTHDFRRKWELIDYESAGLIAQHGFSVPVSDTDYYLRSDLAVIRTSKIFICDVITAYWLFDASNQLKDVTVWKWSDGP